jgi:hypothetical protein
MSSEGSAGGGAQLNGQQLGSFSATPFSLTQATDGATGAAEGTAISSTSTARSGGGKVVGGMGGGLIGLSGFGVAVILLWVV